jgi:pimeloyl-ACP methyl ester carboxylesterase
VKVVDRGSGIPVVVVPGIQGRWEWMAPAVDALAAHCRVITFSLADEPSAEWTTQSSGFDGYVEQVSQALDSAGVTRAIVCGVSYGGLVAAAFARRHPERVEGLALVSAIPPSWRPDARAKFFMRSPRLLLPLFLLGSLRLYPEIAAAYDGWWQGVWAAVRQGVRSITHFPAPGRMARRASIVEDAHLEDLAAVHVPVLVVTGQPGLDRVVPTQLTGEYTRIWPHASAVTLARTGHLGLVTRAEEFARIIVGFAHEAGLPVHRSPKDEGGRTGSYVHGATERLVG